MTIVQIGDRTFRVGATYAPRKAGRLTRPRILDRVQVINGRPRAVYTMMMADGSTWTKACSPRAWLRWAGDEVLP